MSLSLSLSLSLALSYRHAVIKESSINESSIGNAASHQSVERTSLPFALIHRTLDLRCPLTMSNLSIMGNKYIGLY